jgi:hypothetical protein
MADDEAGTDEDGISSLDDGGVALADVGVRMSDVVSILVGMGVVSPGVMTSFVSQIFGLKQVECVHLDGSAGLGGEVCWGGVGFGFSGGCVPCFVGSAGFGLEGA